MIDSFIEEMILITYYVSDTRQNTGIIAMNKAEMFSAHTVSTIYLAGGGRRKLLSSSDTVQYPIMMTVWIATEV